jgi:isochorismate synthase
VYCFQDPILGTWLGASPEKLLTVENNQATTVSLAGTREKSSSVPWSQKEYREQEIVTEYISKELH